MSRHTTRGPDPEAFQTALLRWFQASKRDLPWRGRREPYRVWISEVMLQQTQVATVVPYFERFLARFPTVESLAAAPLPEVLGLWRGLGYYSRARNLHLAAQQIVEQGFPRSAEGLARLPGLGRYTSAAIASLAFGEPVAVLDGNVARVIARLLAIEDPLEAAPVRRLLWDEAGRLLAPRRAGDFNEAMMELGALVCVPGEPRCPSCPVSTQCAARRLGLQAEVPRPKVRPARKKLCLACAVILDGPRLLVARRAERGLFGGLWELPCAAVAGADPREALAAAGLKPTGDEAFAEVRRTLTHRELALSLLRCAPPASTLSGYLELRWVTREELAPLGVSTAMAKAIERAFAEPLRPAGRPSPRASRPARRRPRRAPAKASR